MAVALLLALLIAQAAPSDPLAAQPGPASAPEPPPSTDEGEEVDAIDAILKAAETPPPVVVPPPARAARSDPSRVRPFEMPPVIPTEPVPYAWPLPDEPVTLEAYRGQYEPPKDSVQARYERGVIDNLKRASAIAGPFEGLWRVTDAEGRALYQLALIDEEGDDAEVEGAWRDLRVSGVRASGPIAFARADPARLELRFYEGDGGQATTLTLRRGRGDRWTGDLAVAGQPSRAVVMAAEAP